MVQNRERVSFCCQVRGKMYYFREMVLRRPGRSMPKRVKSVIPDSGAVKLPPEPRPDIQKPGYVHPAE